MPFKIRQPKKRPHQPIEVLQQGGHWVERIYSEYHNAFRWVSILLVLAAIGSVLFWIQSMRAERQAWALEAEASRLYNENPELTAVLEKREVGDKDEHFRKALEIYRQIAEDFPRTSADVIASFYIGNIHFELEQYDQAMEAYQSFLKRYGGKSPLTPLVQSKLGYLFAKSGKREEALKLFQTVMGNNRAINQDQAYYEVGRLYEQMDVPQEAIAAYEKVTEKFEGSPWASESQARLAMLKPQSEPPEGKNLPSVILSAPEDSSGDTHSEENRDEPSQSRIPSESDNPASESPSGPPPK